MATFYTLYPSQFDNRIWVMIPHVDDPAFGEGDLLNIYMRYVPGHVEMVIGPEVLSNWEWRVYAVIGDDVHLPDFLAIPCLFSQNTDFDGMVWLISFRFHGMD